MGDVLQECIHKARLRTQDAMRALNDHLATPKGNKNTSANAERLAYLKGVMHGMHQILTDMEMKQPVQIEEHTVENPSVIENLKSEIRTLRNHAVVLAGALDAYRFYIDAADFELEESKITREQALERARDLDPYDGVTPSEIAVGEIRRPI